MLNANMLKYASWVRYWVWVRACLRCWLRSCVNRLHERLGERFGEMMCKRLCEMFDQNILHVYFRKTCSRIQESLNLSQLTSHEEVLV